MLRPPQAGQGDHRWRDCLDCRCRCIHCHAICGAPRPNPIFACERQLLIQVLPFCDLYSHALLLAVCLQVRTVTKTVATGLHSPVLTNGAFPVVNGLAQCLNSWKSTLL